MTTEVPGGAIIETAPVPAVDEPQPGQRRELAARGALINAAFLILLGTVNVLRSVIVAGFVTTAEFGIWSILWVALALAVGLKAAAVSDKFIQQEEIDQESAFQKAFTLDLITGAALAALMMVLAPLIALAFDRPELLLPGVTLALAMVVGSLQSPIWIFYRRMDFLRQRLLLSVEPLMGFVLTVGLAVAGFGYWALVAGTVGGVLASGIVAAATSPYRLRLRYERTTMLEYVSFSWPLVVAVLSGVGIAMLSVFFGELELGLAGAGAIGLAATISAYTEKADQVITQTLYPAICRVRDRADLLYEAFVKSNRLAVMWGVPFGIGLTLFAADLIEFGIGEKWEPALFLLQVMGLTGAIGHIGFNWTAFYRATGNTRPIAVVTVITLIVFCIAAIPLLLAEGLDGFAIGVGIMTVAALVARWYYIARLFPAMRIAFYMVRAIAPTVVAVGVVLATRSMVDVDRTVGVALGELAVYFAATAAATFVFEHRLLLEAFGYLRRRPVPAGA